MIINNNNNNNNNNNKFKNMPNDCVNEATIRCPDIETYDKLLQSFKKNNWFETFVHISPDNDTNDARYKCWGTKWEAYEFKILRRDKKRFKFVVWFLTAWCPPTGVYSKMKKNFDIETTAMFRDDYFGICKYTKKCEEENFYDFPDNITEFNKLRSTIDFSLYLFVRDMFKDIGENLKDEYKEKKSKLDNELTKLKKEVSELLTQMPPLDMLEKHNHLLIENHKKYIEICKKRKELCEEKKEYDKL